MDPVRTCVGCRQRDSVQKLKRVILVSGKLRFSEVSSGRGAWVHSDCLQLAKDRKGFTRALGAAADAEPEA